MGGRDLALGRRAREMRSWRLTMAGPRTMATAGASPPEASALPQSSATAVSVPSTASGSWAAYLPDAVIRPSTVPGCATDGTIVLQAAIGRADDQRLTQTVAQRL